MLAFRTFIKTIQKPLKFDTKEFENKLKIAILKNITFELGVIIRNQTKNRFEKRSLTFWSCWDGGLRTEIMEIGREVEDMKTKLSLC